MFNEIDGDFDDVAIRTFKVCQLVEHDLRKSLTRKPVRVCVGLWIALMSSGSKRTSNRERGRLRWSFRTEGILGRTCTIIANLGEILRGTLDQLLLR